MALHHAVAGEVVRLPSVANSDTRTAALVKTDSFETIHLVVRASDHIPEHKVTGSISLFCIEGMVIIEMEDGERRMKAGDWLYLEPDQPHGLRSVEDASLILTILFDQRVPLPSRRIPR